MSIFVTNGTDHIRGTTGYKFGQDKCNDIDLYNIIHVALEHFLFITMLTYVECIDECFFDLYIVHS